MASKGFVEFSYNRAIIDSYIGDALRAEVAQIFEADIKPMAQDLSPVDLGTNRRSITTEVIRLENGSLQAEIFTQSGYGGYLELGHRVAIGPRGAGFLETHEDSGEYRMVQGRPYIYPSVMAYMDALKQATQTAWSRRS